MLPIKLMCFVSYERLPKMSVGTKTNL